ncbi:hypothetical protein [Aquimarina sp. Aq78]|uniref:hypothetical protein n=1 Tax=Aquimarina sp. Aq78 TaxID=1191889 RepID=UPI000D0E56BE|nr:hypothetical protein [Aquimarina sp. Aq78]
MTKKHRKVLYPIILFLGLGLMIWQIIIYRNTIINVIIPIVIVSIVSLIAFVVDFKNYKNTYDKYSGVSLTFYAIMQSLFSYGFIACSIFILTNYYLADKKSVKKSYLIIERSSLPGRKYHRDERKPTFYINYEGTKKELVFPHKYYEKMESYKNVEFEVREGYLGFDILENKTLN